MDAANALKSFKVLGDESRLEIISILQGGEKCACVLLEKMNISQSTLSHHMKALVESNIVLARKSGKWTYYTIDVNEINKLKEFLDTITISKEVLDNKTILCEAEDYNEE